mmetsp:Transcript_55279/g.109820  ORF Transcript_55279/g.109820 Transcript_55279/m.109820 type:complete len:261 (-) Transcript_55279:341-1123(-)
MSKPISQTPPAALREVVPCHIGNSLTMASNSAMPCRPNDFAQTPAVRERRRSILPARRPSRARRKRPNKVGCSLRYTRTTLALKELLADSFINRSIHCTSSCEQSVTWCRGTASAAGSPASAACRSCDTPRYFSMYSSNCWSSLNSCLWYSSSRASFSAWARSSIRASSSTVIALCRRAATYFLSFLTISQSLSNISSTFAPARRAAGPGITIPLSPSVHARSKVLPSYIRRIASEGKANRAANGTRMASNGVVFDSANR